MHTMVKDDCLGLKDTEILEIRILNQDCNSLVKVEPEFGFKEIFEKFSWFVKEYEIEDHTVKQIRLKVLAR